MRERVQCPRCRRPEVVCWCSHLPSLPTKTKVVLLQHPREYRMAIGTARMAHLALPNSVLRVGLRFDGASVPELALGAHVLFPGEGAVDVRDLPAPPSTLVVLDGTWSQARALLKRNPAVEALPRVAFSPARQSDYRIRRQPAEQCVSTIEALAEVLEVIEGGSFEDLLKPFRAMVDRQIWFKTEVAANRHKKRQRKPRPAPKPTLAMRIAAEWERIVCIQMDANAWPVETEDRPVPEVVHFVATRIATGEKYEAVIAPRQRFSPTTPHHVELSAERILGGSDLATWRATWAEFVRPDDVIVQWGRLNAKWTRADGVFVPEHLIDLRSELAQTEGLRAGTVENAVTRLGAVVEPIGFDGRAARRLSGLVAVLRALRVQAA